MSTLSHRIVTRSAQVTESVGQLLGSIARPGDVVLLTGDLGAGKTVVSKGVARGLGVAEPVTSPTFNILLVHEGRIPLNHFDLYRLEHADQLEDVDYFGTIEADGISLVEWGDRFPEAVPDSCVLVTISIDGDAERTIAIEGRGERGARLAGEWADALLGASGVEPVGAP